MKIIINGRPREFTQQLSLEQLIDMLKLSPAHVVVELNSEILSADQFSSCLINENDRLEIIQFVGGG